jgi:hypothetical protein
MSINRLSGAPAASNSGATSAGVSTPVRSSAGHSQPQNQALELLSGTSGQRQLAPEGSLAPRSRLPDQPATATEPSAPGGESEQVAPHPRSGQPLSDDNVKLGSYMAARSLVGQPLSSDNVDRLRRANATLDETRTSLEYGRGNVVSDLRRTDHQSRYRALAARALTHELKRQHGGHLDAQHVAHAAAAALSLGAGRCGDYAAASTVLHAARMSEDERVHIMNSLGHNWTEVRTVGNDASPITIDGWSNGLAILASDSAQASRPQASVVELDRDSALAALNHARTLAQGLVANPQDIQRRIDSKVPFLAPIANKILDPLMPSERSVVSRDFTHRVRQQMEAGGSRATASHAVAVARSLGSSPATLHDDVKRIDEAVRTYFGDR